MSKDSEASSDLDIILALLGPFGKYNILNYALLLFPIYLAGMFGSVYVFEAPDINYRCAIDKCENPYNYTDWLQYAIPQDKGKPSKCKMFAIKDTTVADNGTCSPLYFDNSIIEQCNKYVYSSEDSVVKDFNLGCQNWKRTLIGTIHNAGLFISLPCTGVISDKYGRRVALSIASLMNGIFGFIRSFSTNYTMLICFEFLEAALGAGAYSTAFVIAMELVGPRGRVFGNTIINAVYVLGLMSLSGLSWWLQSWRTVLRVIYSPALLVFSYLWLLNESVRWLLSKGRNVEAAEILKKAAKMNKVDLSDQVLSPLYELEKIAVTETLKEKDNINEGDIAKPIAKPIGTTSNFRKVMKSSIILKRVFTCSFLWITCTFVYYGLSINSVSLAGNMYVNFMLVAFVEIPANFACLLVLDKFGRKKTLITTYVLSACLCISLSFIPKDQKWLSLVLYLSGKFAITVAYSSVYIYVSEVFPTSVRQSLLAVCSSLGRVGSSLAPLTPLLEKVYFPHQLCTYQLAWHILVLMTVYYHNLPAIFFGCLALMASVMVIPLPETINVALPDTIEEAEKLSNSNKVKRYESS